MIIKHLFKQIWSIIDLICFIFGASLIVIALFLWAKIAGFIGLGVVFIVLGYLFELLAATKES